MPGQAARSLAQQAVLASEPSFGALERSGSLSRSFWARVPADKDIRLRLQVVPGRYPHGAPADSGRGGSGAATQAAPAGAAPVPLPQPPPPTGGEAAATSVRLRQRLTALLIPGAEEQGLASPPAPSSRPEAEAKVGYGLLLLSPLLSLLLPLPWLLPRLPLLLPRLPKLLPLALGC